MPSRLAARLLLGALGQHLHAPRGALRAETRDVLMVSYLAGVTKAQLAIGAKLHESF